MYFEDHNIISALLLRLCQLFIWSDPVFLIVQNIYLEAGACLPEQVNIYIPVSGKLQQEFPPVAAVGYMITGMIKKSPSTSRHLLPQFFDYRPKCTLK